MANNDNKSNTKPATNIAPTSDTHKHTRSTTDTAHKPTTSSTLVSEPKTNPVKTKKRFPWLSFLFFIPIAGGLVYLAFVCYTLRQELVQLNHEVVQTNNELSSLRLLDQQPIIQNLMRELNDQRSIQQQYQDEITQLFVDLQKEFDTNRSLSERRKDDWILHEVAYLLRMASTRLYLANDYAASSAALTQADLRLGDLHNPIYLPIRKKLADEITSLQNLKTPDIDGVVLKLERLFSNIAVLPKALLSTKNKVEQPTTTSQESLQPSWLHTLFNTIGVKANSQPLPTLAQRDNALFLDQLLRLELESAKQALIRYKQADFIRHMNSAQQLVTQHYKQNDANVITILDQITAIIDLQIFPELPDITTSLNLLQSTLNRHDLNHLDGSTPEQPPASSPKNEQPASPSDNKDTTT